MVDFCLYARRLCDMGRSSWGQAAPHALALAGALTFVTGMQAALKDVVPEPLEGILVVFGLIGQLILLLRLGIAPSRETEAPVLRAVMKATGWAAAGACVIAALAIAWFAGLKLYTTREVKAVWPAAGAQIAAFTLDDGHIHLPVRINGRPATALLDTGAETSSISLKFARSLGLPLLPGAATNGRITPFTGGVTFALGDFQMGPMPVVIDPSPDAVDAILGRQLFDHAVTVIDFDAQSLQLVRPETFIPPPGATRLSLKRLRPRKLATTEVSVSGKPPLCALVDTGSNLGLIVHPKAAETLGLKVGKSAQVSGFLRVYDVRPVLIPSLGFAGAEFRRVPAAIGALIPNCDAVLGTPVLKRYRLYLDLKRDRMWLEPGQWFGRSFSRLMGAGIDRVDGKNIIVDILPGSPADKAGLKVGDVIHAVNGQTQRFKVKMGQLGVLEIDLEGGARRSVAFDGKTPPNAD